MSAFDWLPDIPNIFSDEPSPANQPAQLEPIMGPAIEGVGNGDPASAHAAFSHFTTGRVDGPPPVQPEGRLGSARAEHAQAAPFITDSTDPSSDEGMQQLVDQTGHNRDVANMGPHERLKFLADNDMAPNLIPPRHRELMETEIPDEAKDSLMKLDQDVHNPYELGRGNYNIDEYSVILDELPDGMTEKEFLDSFLANPNAAANSEDFDFYNEFHAKRAGSNEDLPAGEGADNGAPGVGDWYNIDIPGNDGDVMIVDKDGDAEEDGRVSATVQTMTDDQWAHAENHPVSGRRQFGLEKLPDGGYRFYTRGFDRPEGLAENHEGSRSAQHKDWSAMMAGVAKQHGGRAEQFDDEGNPIWGWHEHISAEDLLESGVQNRHDGPQDLDIP